MAKKTRPRKSPPAPPPPTEPAPETGGPLADPAAAGLLPQPTPHARAVEQLLRWIAKGASPLEQSEALAKHFPEADPAAVYQAAINHIAGLADPDPIITRGFVFLSTQELYRRAVESGDLSAALRALRFLAGLAAAASPPPAPPGPPTH